MHEWAPIEVNEDGAPVDMKQLSILLDRLEELEIKNAPARKEDIGKVLDQIIDFYTDNEIKESYPINLGVFQKVEQQLQDIDGIEPPSPDSMMLSGRNPSAPGTTEDLTKLLSTLSKHYKTNLDQLEDDVKMMEESGLVDIFEAMCTYYTIGDGWNKKEAPEMWSFFDYLAELYGQKSDWDLDEAALEDLYNQMQVGPLPEDTFFENQKVTSFEDMLEIERE